MSASPPSHDATVEAWERAYAAFETPEQEVRKFLARLRSLGVEQWTHDTRILELCCGRGSGLEAWLRLGFRNVEGLDISEPLIRQYPGEATVHVGDARALPFENASFDVVCVQGGLHHLQIMDDLRRSLRETHRVLKPNGHFVLVEPWLTPFLRFVHAACALGPARKAWPRLDALKTMIDLERDTYEPWLATPGPVLDAIESVIEPTTIRRRWGKLMMVGRRRERVDG